MSPAHRRSWLAAAGWQEKILRRLGVSDTPVTLSGPAIARSCRCGAIVTPYPVPMRVSTSVNSMGASKSSTGPTDRGTKAAAMRCGPALIATGGDFDDRGAFAVDGDFEQLLLPRHVHGGVAEQLSADRANECRLELVEAVGRERVHERRPAARSERRALDVQHLVFGGRHDVRRGRR